MRGWPFKQPKTPGFGINKGYYLSVLASTARLPSVLQVINPKGEDGALKGFGAPLSPGASKDDLDRPMQRGAYAIATPDQKTVLRLVIVSKEEAGFDPDAFLRSSLGVTISAEMAARIRATWTLLQLTFEVHDPMVYPAVDFFLGLAGRLAMLSDGVVGDAISQRYILPAEVFAQPRKDPQVDARELVSVNVRADGQGLHAYTLGMQKFFWDKGPLKDKPVAEFEIYGVSDTLFREVESVLYGLCQAVLTGKMVRPGDVVGSKAGALEIREGGLDRGRWEGISVVELIPARGHTIDDSIRGMAIG